MSRPSSPPPDLGLGSDIHPGPHTGDGPGVFDVAGSDVSAQAEPPSGQVDGLWFVAAVLWQRRVLLLAVALLAGVAGVALSLAMPKWYSAETRVMLPNSSG